MNVFPGNSGKIHQKRAHLALCLLSPALLQNNEDMIKNEFKSKDKNTSFYCVIIMISKSFTVDRTEKRVTSNINICYRATSL